MSSKGGRFISITLFASGHRIKQIEEYPAVFQWQEMIAVFGIRCYIIDS